MGGGFATDRLDRIIGTLSARYIASGAIPGALLQIWRRGETRYLGMAGSIDLARDLPMREDAIFRIYSMTKPVTSVAVMMLVEQGRIGLDDPVHRYIPEFADLPVYAGGGAGAFETRPAGRAMTVMDLMRHTSGLTYGFLNRTPLDAAYRKLGVGEANTVGGLPAMIAQLKKLPLEFSPGEAWNYSVATDVLGYLVEKISGTKFSDFVRRRILQPLGMADSDFFVPVEKRERFASCYYSKDEKLLVFDDAQTSSFASLPRLDSGGGGLCGTAADYMCFCRMLLGGGALEGTRLLSPKSVALMTMNHLPGGRQMTEMMPDTATFNEAGYSGVGFGLGVAVTIDLPATGLPGSVGEYSWGGAAGTYFFNDPKEDMAVVFMTQVLGSPDRIRLRRELRSLVYGAMTESFCLMREAFDLRDWRGPFDSETRMRARDALEDGRVLYFPHLAFPLQAAEQAFLDASLTDGKAKNISLDHTSGKLQGTSATGERAVRLAAMIERFGAAATQLVNDLIGYSRIERARTSFRPVEVEDRPYSVIQDDRLLHIDAFPSRPMQNGRRILRFFSNVAPPGGGERCWEVGENFESFAGKFLPRLRPHPPGKSWLYEKLGVTRGKRSAYDELMLSLHDAAKRAAHYQKTAPHTQLAFPPGSSWLVYTDQVLHAALAGEFALEQTFHLDIAAMAAADQSPLHVLERLTGKSLGGKHCGEDGK